MTPATWAVVDLERIRQNVRSLRSLIPGALMAVVKADGYGHGAVPVARAALEAGASWLGVARVQEGRALREAGLDVPILVLGHIPPEEYPEARRLELRLTVSTLRHLPPPLSGEGPPLRFHVKADTGMGRIGGTAEDVTEILLAVRELPGTQAEGLFTHFANADTPEDGAWQKQWQRFGELRQHLETAGLLPPLLHAENSAALLALPDTRGLSLARTGIALYGLNPLAVAPPVPLLPALSWFARVSQVKEVEAGSRIGYGGTYRVPHAQRILTVSAGYGDGYPRILSGKGRVEVAGQVLPVVGRVSMDQITVAAPLDLSVREGDAALLLSPDPDSPLGADALAALAGTISYEIMTRIGCRVPRFYAGE